MSDRAVEVAADWMARLGAEDCTQEDRAAFADWCGQDARHAQIAAMMGGVWSQTGRAAQPAGLASRRSVVLGGVGAVLASAALAPMTADARILRTTTGEIRRVPLPRGTLVLDTQSAVMWGAKGYALTLMGGRFGLTCEPGVMRIAAGHVMLSTQGGRFDIRQDARSLAVTVLAGDVMVNDRTLLHSGERLTIGADGGCVRDRPDLRDLLAWQSGRIAFRDTPLREALAEMNRYSTTHLLADGRSDGLRISGYYHVGNPQAFARALAQLLPVRVVATGHDLRIVKL